MLFLRGWKAIQMLIVVATIVPGAAERASAQQRASSAGRRQGVHVDTLHGIAVPDPHRWLEEVHAPDVRRWIREQDRLARRQLAAWRSRGATAALVSRTAGSESFVPLAKENGRYFISRLLAVGPQRGITVYVRDSATGASTTVIDEAEQRRIGRPARQALPSPDGALLAYGAGADASEWQTVRVRDVTRLTDLADSVSGVHRFAPFVSWAREPGRAGFYYTRFRVPPGGPTAGRPLESGAVWFHRLGDPQANDELVLALRDSTVLTPTAKVTDDGAYLVITVRRGTARASSIWVQELGTAAQRSRPPRLLVPANGANHVFLGNDGSVFWIATDHQAPRGRVIAIDATRPEREHWRDIVPEGADAIDAWNVGAAVGGRLIVLYRRDAVLVGKVFDREGKFLYELPVPGRGSIWTGISGKTTDTEALFSVQGVADPGTIHRLDVREGTIAPFLRSNLPYDPSPIVTEQLFYRGRDGVRIPMYVVRRRDVALDGKAPLWIYGYGAQRWTAAPWFQPPVAAWLLGGGVWAVPSLRGGAEYGETWFEAGSRRNKQAGIDDYIAAVEWLIANRYTSTGRVVAHTSSAGGVLVAAAVVQRPELFGAAVMEYPVLDILRYEHLLTGNRWSDDYGTIADSADARAMLAYAPIQLARRGTCYPSMLVTPGEHDQTAAPAHAYKFVAAMRAAQSCEGRPVMLRVSWGAGHTAGATLRDATANWVDQLTFVQRALGARAAQRPAAARRTP